MYAAWVWLFGLIQCYGCQISINNWLDNMKNSFQPGFILLCWATHDSLKPSDRPAPVLVLFRSQSWHLRVSFFALNLKFDLFGCSPNLNADCMVLSPCHSDDSRNHWVDIAYLLRGPVFPAEIHQGTSGVSFLRYSMPKNIVILKSLSTASQGLWKWHHSIDWFPISVL